MMNVWTYWAGPMPRWIETCLLSFARCCRRSRFRLLTPHNLPPGLDLPERWLSLPPGVGTDCLRAALLSQYGGLWADADTVFVADPADLIDGRHLPTQLLYSRWPTPPDRVIAGYVYSPEGHPVARQWHDRVRSALLHAEGVGWGELGERALTPLVNSCPSSTWQVPLDTFLPVSIDAEGVRRFFCRSGWRDFATERTIAFGLNFSWMMDKMKPVMEADPEGSPLMIHRLLYDAQEAADDGAE